MLKVLIVDDSNTSRRLLRHIVNSAPDMTVVGALDSGEKAVKQVKKLRPDVILMDIVMSGMDGLDATGEIMEKHPTPIVMISGAIQGKETEMAFQAIKRGALTLLSKPVGPDDPAFDAQAKRLTGTLRAMAGVRVIHHIKRKQASSSRPRQASIQSSISEAPAVAGIVASTGGPAALAEISQRLPVDFPIPIVVVQHIAGDFLPSLVKWLQSISPLHVKLAEEGEIPQAGTIYMAPFGRHLYFDEKRRFAFRDTPRVSHIPSGDILLESIAEQYGAAAVGIILTGMGADGANGLLQMRQAGAITIAQNEHTSAVYGMPAAAQQVGAVQYTLSLPMIAPTLREVTERELS